jgi:FMN phosphatase YigB (HAD superfamily)
MHNFLVFDVGETLIDFHKNAQWITSLQNEIIPLLYHDLKSNSKTFNETVYPILSKQDMDINQKNLSLLKRIEEYLQFFGVSKSKNIIKSQLDMFSLTFEKDVTIYADTWEALNVLIQQKYKLGLFSNTPWQSPGILIEKILAKFDLIRFFEYRLFSGDLEIRKLDPAVLRKLMQVSHMRKENKVYIGDSEVDIEVAHNFGILAIWINRSGISKLKTENPPEFQIGNLNELLDLLPI